jgi:hypothetical protein
MDKVVAQISKSAVSQVSNLRGASRFRPPADLEIGDTAGLEANACQAKEGAVRAAEVFIRPAFAGRGGRTFFELFLAG